MYAVMFTNGTIETMVYGNLQSFIQGPHEKNQWYHIALIYDGQTFKTYLDGDLVASVDTPENIFECTGQDLIIGAMQIGDFKSLNGNVDDVSLWNISLDQETIQSNMNTELTGIEEGLIGYWNFNEGEGSELTDLSGNGYNGTIYGASWSGDSAPIEPPSYGCTDSYAGNYDPNAVLDDGSSNIICLIASIKGWLSISPTVPPISTIAISAPFAPSLILLLISSVI